MVDDNYRLICVRLRVLLVEKRQEIRSLNLKINLLNNRIKYLLEQRGYDKSRTKLKFEDIPSIKRRRIIER